MSLNWPEDQARIAFAFSVPDEWHRELGPTAVDYAVWSSSNPFRDVAGYSYHGPNSEFETPFLRAICILGLEESLPPGTLKGQERLQ